MASSRENIALEWTRTELLELLDAARRALEAHAHAQETGAPDGSHLEDCVRLLHQLHGTLLVLQLRSANTFTAELEAVARALANGSLSDPDAASETLMQGLLELPEYLEEQRTGMGDTIAPLLSLLNELRGLRGESPIAAPGPRWSPAAAPSQVALERFRSIDGVDKARKIRAVYQQVLLSVLKGGEARAAIGTLEKVAAGMQRLTEGMPHELLWQAFDEFLKVLELDLAEESSALGAEAVKLLRRMDSELRAIAQDGAAAFERPVPVDALRQLADGALTRDGGHTFFRELRAILSDSIRVEAFSSSGRRALASAAAALREDLTGIRDRVDLMVRNTEAIDSTGVSALVAALKQITSTMAILGLESSRAIVAAELDALQETTPDQARLEEMAAALLQVDENLASLTQGDKGEAELITDAAQRAVLDEARRGMERLKQGIVDYVSSQWDVRHLDQLPEELNGIVGALRIIPLTDAARLVERCARYVEDQLRAGHVPDWDELDRFAGAVSGLDYYLERLAGPASAGVEEILEYAERSLDQVRPVPLLQPEQPPVPDAAIETGAASESEAVPVDDGMFQPAEHEGALAAADAVPDYAEWSLPGTVPEQLERGFEEETSPAAVADTAAEDADSLPATVLEPVLDATDEPPASQAAIPAVELLPEYQWEPAADADRQAAPDFQADAEPWPAREPEADSGSELHGSELQLAFDEASPAERAAEPEGMLEFELEPMRLSGEPAPPEWLPADIEEPVEAEAAEQPAAPPESVPEAETASALSAAHARIAGLADNFEVDTEILEIFLEEVDEVLEAIDSHLEPWRGDLTEGQHAVELRRSFHTLKGSGRLVGARVLGELAWSIENMLNRVLDGTIAADAGMLATIAEARALVPSLRDAFAAATGVPPGDVALIVERAERIAAGLEPEEAPAEAPVEAPPGASVDEPLEEPLAEPVAETTTAWQLNDEPIVIEPEPAEAFEPLVSFVPAQEQDAALAESAGELAIEPVIEWEAEAEAEALAEGQPPPETGAPAAVEIDESRELFCTEAESYLAVLGGARHGAGYEFDDRVVRALHTLTGSAAMVGFGSIAEFARATLNLVQALLGSKAQVTVAGDEAAFFDDALRTLADDVAALRAGGEPGRHDKLAAEADRLRLETPAASLTATLLALPQLDALLDAQEALAAGGPARDALTEALDQLHDFAASEELPALAQLTDALRGAHRRLAGKPLDVHAQQVLRAGHERVLAQIDGLVAGQSVPVAQELLVALDALVVAIPEPAAEEPLRPPPVPADLEAVAEPEPAPQPAGADVERLAASDIDPELLEIFLEEADELLEQMDEAIQSCAAAPDAPEPIEGLLRGLHTLKGGARLAGLAVIGDVAHDFESWIIALREAGAAFSGAEVEGLQRRHDGLVALVAAVRDGSSAGHAQISVPDVDTAGVDAAEPAAGNAVDEMPVGEKVVAEKLVAEGAPDVAGAAEVTPRPALVQAAPRAVSGGESRRAEYRPDVDKADSAAAPARTEARGSEEVVRVRSALLDQLVNLAGESSIIRARVQQGLSEFGGALDEMETTIARLREQLRRLEIETEAQILFRREHLDGPSYEDFDPLELDRYSQLQQLSRSLSESASDMLDLKETLRVRAGETDALLVQQARVNTELQEGLMRSRMVPFARLLPRLRRIVRQIAQETGKSVELEAYNVEGELDRSLLDRMIAPLEHMLRNAVDHGIEPRERRRLAGKPESGRIELRLAREGGDVVIEISDDGAGIDVERVRAKAIERGLLAEDADLDDDQVRQFIFAPGFSTATTVTQISGRGVGMDVVHSEVKQLGGSIEVASQPGRGARFSLRVPFTVSVNRALMVAVGDDLYAVPLNTIEGIVLVPREDLERMAAPGGAPFEYAGVPYHVRHLGQFLGRGVRAGVTGAAPVVLVRAGELAVAIQVDGVQGSREIVVKGLGPPLAGVAGISGATILGDGSVVVILDLLALVRTRQNGVAAGRKRTSAAARRARTVLVVDDSVTVRKVTSRLLERQGMEVTVAKDGVEAVALLQERKPDIMLLDIEMPRMDGFEVLRHVRHDARLADLPVVMISSRTGAKHQDRAAELGVSRFLGKPFQEPELLATIENLLR